MYSLMHQKVDDIKKEIINYRRDFHKYPETGWTEMRTASLIARVLDDLGYEVLVGKDVMKSEDRMGLPDHEIFDKHYIRAKNQGADPIYLERLKDGFTGVVGVLNCGNGPVVGIRFDIDALEVTESEDVNHVPSKEGFKSLNEGIMHGCGHDGHAAMGLGLAKVFSEMKDNFKGTIKLIFQPAEEGVRGAKSIANSGILDDVEYILSGHIGLIKNGSGKIFCNLGEFMATSKFDAYFVGRPTHAGGSPEKGKNALLAASTAVLNLNSIPRHSKGQTRINVGKLIAGSGRNVIPSDAKMLIETRGSTTELNNYMTTHATRILKSSADMYDVKIEIKQMGGAQSSKNDNSLIDLIKKVGRNIDRIQIIDDKVDFGGSEDFSYMMNKVQNQGGKAMYLIIGSNIKADHHNGEFDFEEEDLITGVKLYSTLIYELMKK